MTTMTKDLKHFRWIFMISRHWDCTCLSSSTPFSLRFVVVVFLGQVAGLLHVLREISYWYGDGWYPLPAFFT